MAKRPKLARSLTDIERVVLGAFVGEQIPDEILTKAIEALELSGTSFDGVGYPSQLDAAVAEVLLQSLCDVLPQWAIMEAGAFIRGRRKVKPNPSPFVPDHLFTINWADSAPGFSWPVAYYATRVPDFARVIVTASADGEDGYGFVDFAIGLFPASQDPIAGAQTVICRHWAERAEDGQRRWTQLLEEGTVNESLASMWADQITWEPET